METFLLTMLLEQHKEIMRLRQKVAELSGDMDA
jgi:hypothetical protein